MYDSFPMAQVIFAVVVVAVIYLAWRAGEIFCVSVRNGRALVIRGRVPPPLLRAIREIIHSQPEITRATIRAVRGEHGARLTARGAIDEGRVQRLRNAFGLYPVAKLRAAPPITRPTLGQVLGIAWLAWMLDRGRGFGRDI
jgi:hypothetical protein